MISGKQKYRLHKTHSSLGRDRVIISTIEWCYTLRDQLKSSSFYYGKLSIILLTGTYSFDWIIDPWTFWTYMEVLSIFGCKFKNLHLGSIRFLRKSSFCYHGIRNHPDTSDAPVSIFLPLRCFLTCYFRHVYSVYIMKIIEKCFVSKTCL